MILEASSSGSPGVWPLAIIDGAVSLIVCFTPASVRFEDIESFSEEVIVEGDIITFCGPE